jgi:hypothetical protein
MLSAAKADPALQFEWNLRELAIAAPLHASTHPERKTSVLLRSHCTADTARRRAEPAAIASAA